MLLVLLLSSCLKQEFEQNLPPQTPESDFLYETVHSKYMDIKFRDLNGTPLHHAYFEVFSENPFTDGQYQFSSMISSGKLLFKGNANENGEITLGLNMPDFIDTIYLCPRYIGLNAYYPFPAVNENAELIISPLTEDTTLLKYSEPENYKSTGSVNDDFTFLGGYNNQGKPDYLEPVGDEITQDLLADINATLPEGAPLTQTHPQYLASGLESDMVLEDSCEVWVTFVHEGAGYKNVLGYFHYPLDNPPQSVAEIDKMIIIFPNASYQGSGGKLHSGDKVKLKYFAPGSNDPVDVFPAGTGIGWFMIANGFQNYQVTGGYYIHYSHPSFNIESDPGIQQHHVLLSDEERDLILLGFEDIRRDASWCDNDFNDAVFYATANPITAVNTSNLQMIDDPLDSDYDGVSDVFDEYPTDPTRAYNNYYPDATGFGTLVYEDLWPFKGDYDFNDMVIDYRYNLVTNSSNEVVELKTEFVLRAIGGSFENGFAFALDDLGSDMVASVTGSSLTSGLFQLNGNGTEAGQPYAVIPVFENCYHLMTPPAGGVYVNTWPGDTWVEPDTIFITVQFTSPLSMNQTGLPPFNPFIIVNQNRSVEVHLPGKQPTALVDYSLFGTGNDQSDPETGKYYFSSYDYPWAANVPTRFDYPVEKVNIEDAHLNFDDWAESSGFNYMDWFLDKPGYRDESKIFSESNK
ncbi:MAG: LruC domain-containing protein [Bacteroidales bacterium]